MPGVIGARVREEGELGEDGPAAPAEDGQRVHAEEAEAAEEKISPVLSDDA